MEAKAVDRSEVMGFPPPPIFLCLLYDLWKEGGFTFAQQQVGSSRLPLDTSWLELLALSLKRERARCA
jgi:hypothetical protein